MNNKEQEKKGTFSSLRLSISKKYIYPLSRGRMLLLGLAICVLIGGYFSWDAVYLNRHAFVSSGPLSANHANLETDCSSCHVPFASAANHNCSQCHEPSARSTIFSFASHYQYRSDDQTRVQTAKATVSGKEMACASCHPEHRGREASIISDLDRQCLACHNFGSFNDRHPEFEFIVNKTPDDAGLIFTHINHVMGYVGGDAETACGTCHVPDVQGRNFSAINFDSHCDECHGPHQRENLVQLQRRNSACRTCHVVVPAGMLRVRAEQRVLHRAKFNHAAHTLARGCLDCHTAIPMGQNMPGTAEADESATQNIPGISNCQSCHQASLSSNRCTTCHEFHPNKSRRFGFANF